MSTTGGSVISISLNGRQFAIPADTDLNIKRGGFESETQANGDGTVRNVKTRVPWGILGCVVSINDSQQDHQYLQGLADGNAEIDVVMELASGAIETGKGYINGELQRATQATTASFDLMGQGKLNQQ